MKIYKYRKITDSITTYCLLEPDYNLLDENAERVQELAVIAGYTYVSVPDSINLPEQPPQIVLIPAEHPSAAIINEEVVEMIRCRYSINDEIKMLRIGPSAETSVYNAYVEECRAWGRSEKVKLGLG
jgi:hypothetical protein